MQFRVVIRCDVEHHPPKGFGNTTRDQQLAIPVEADGWNEAIAKVEKALTRLVQENAETDWWDHG